MEVYRLAREAFAALSGRGASIAGGRWNSVGIEMIYTAQNRSLAMAEVAVHLTLATMPKDYVMLTINVPDDISLQEISEAELPKKWNVFPHTEATKLIGDTFIAEHKCCVLKVPSAITKGDFNLLINPKHKDFEAIKLIKQEPFPFDRRIIK